MAVLAYTDRTGTRSYVCKWQNDGSALRWSEHITDAAEFADAAAVTAFLSGKTTFTIAAGDIQTVTAGQPNYGKRQH